MSRTHEEVQAAIRAVAPVVRAAAEEAERASEVAQHVIDALHAQRLFRLWIPQAFGGDALALPASLRAFEEASRLDGSLGFLVMIGVGGGLFGAFMREDAASDVFGPLDALIGGSGAAGGEARLVRGGYRASGDWGFASGAPHATWFTANCVLSGRGVPARTIRAMAFPAAEVTIDPTWEVSGLRATASHSFSVDDAFVPVAYAFSVFTDQPRQPEPLYRYPFGSIAQVSFAAVALGIGRHAIEEFAASASTRRLARARTALHADPSAEEAFARAEGLLRSARALFYETADASWATVGRGRRLSRADEDAVHLAAVQAAASARRAVGLLAGVSGTAPLYMQSVLGRCARDIEALVTHSSLSPLRMRDLGRSMLARARRAAR